MFSIMSVCLSVQWGSPLGSLSAPPQDLFKHIHLGILSVIHLGTPPGPLDLFKLVHLVSVPQIWLTFDWKVFLFSRIFWIGATRDEERVPMLKERKMVAIVKDRRQLQKYNQANSSPFEFFV